MSVFSQGVRWQIHLDMALYRVCGGVCSLVGVFKLPLGFLLKLETAAASLRFEQTSVKYCELPPLLQRQQL